MGMAFKSADELNAERLADRHVHLNSNGFVLGTSSAGKSCRTAQQILDSALDAEGGGAMV